MNYWFMYTRKNNNQRIYWDRSFMSDVLWYSSEFWKSIKATQRIPFSGTAHPDLFTRKCPCAGLHNGPWAKETVEESWKEYHDARP